MASNLKVENVKVEVDMHGSSTRLGTCVEADVNGTHYHFWINARTLEHSAALYQRCKTRDVHNREQVRALDSELERNARVVAAVLDVVKRDELIAKGRQARQEKLAREQAARDAQYEEQRLARARLAAGPKAIAALEALLEHLPALWGDQVREGELTLRVEANAVHDAIAALELAKGR